MLQDVVVWGDGSPLVSCDLVNPLPGLMIRDLEHWVGAHCISFLWILTYAIFCFLLFSELFHGFRACGCDGIERAVRRSSSGRTGQSTSKRTASMSRCFASASSFLDWSSDACRAAIVEGATMGPNGMDGCGGRHSGGSGDVNINCSGESPVLTAAPWPPLLPLPFHPRSCSHGPLPGAQHPLPPAFQSG